MGILHGLTSSSINTKEQGSRWVCVNGSMYKYEIAGDRRVRKAFHWFCSAGNDAILVVIIYEY